MTLLKGLLGAAVLGAFVFYGANGQKNAGQLGRGSVSAGASSSISSNDSVPGRFLFSSAGTNAGDVSSRGSGDMFSGFENGPPGFDSPVSQPNRFDASNTNAGYAGKQHLEHEFGRDWRAHAPGDNAIKGLRNSDTGKLKAEIEGFCARIAGLTANRASLNECFEFLNGVFKPSDASGSNLTNGNKNDKASFKKGYKDKTSDLGGILKLFTDLVHKTPTDFEKYGFVDDCGKTDWISLRYVMLKLADLFTQALDSIDNTNIENEIQAGVRPSLDVEGEDSSAGQASTGASSSKTGKTGMSSAKKYQGGPDTNQNSIISTPKKNTDGSFLIDER